MEFIDEGDDISADVGNMCDIADGINDIHTTR